MPVVVHIPVKSNTFTVMYRYLTATTSSRILLVGFFWTSCSSRWCLYHVVAAAAGLEEDGSVGMTAATASVAALDMGASFMDSSSIASPNAISSSLSSSSSPSTRHIQRARNISEHLDIDELYQVYKEMETTYWNTTLGSSSSSASSWKILNVHDGVEVSLLEHEQDPTCPYIRMQATFPVPVQDVWDFLRVPHWDRTMPQMDPYYEGVAVYGGGANMTYSNEHVDMLLCRKRTKRILAFGKRDFVFLAVTQKHEKEDTWVSGTVSVETTHFPRQQGYTRAFQDSIAFYKPITSVASDGSSQNHTQLAMICRIDLNDSTGDTGGWIPMWLYVKTIGYTGVRAFARMRQALLQPQE